MIRNAWEYLRSQFCADIAMDLGTANTLLYIRDRGVLVNEPSVVALDANGGGVRAVGLEAKRMFGRTHSKLRTIRPMKDGVIADFEVTNQMISYFIKKVLNPNRLFKPRMVVGVPTCITQVEKRAVIDSAQMAGAREVYLVDEPMAAAIGVGIPVHKPEGNMIIDIGGGTTDVAVASLSAIAYGESIRVAGDEMDEAIVRYMRLNHHLNIGIFEAERVKMTVGNAFPQVKPLVMDVKGLDVKNGVPVSIQVNDSEIREAMKEPVSNIITAVLRALEKTPPELSADIHSNGIYLTGGGALIRGLDKIIEEKTGLKVYIPNDPLTSIVRGVGAILDNFQEMKKVCIN